MEILQPLNLRRSLTWSGHKTKLSWDSDSDTDTSFIFVGEEAEEVDTISTANPAVTTTTTTTTCPPSLIRTQSQPREDAERVTRMLDMFDAPFIEEQTKQEDQAQEQDNLAPLWTAAINASYDSEIENAPLFDFPFAYSDYPIEEDNIRTFSLFKFPTLAQMSKQGTKPSLHASISARVSTHANKTDRLKTDGLLSFSVVNSNLPMSMNYEYNPPPEGLVEHDYLHFDTSLDCPGKTNRRWSHAPTKMKPSAVRCEQKKIERKARRNIEPTRKIFTCVAGGTHNKRHKSRTDRRGRAHEIVPSGFKHSRQAIAACSPRKKQPLVDRPVWIPSHARSSKHRSTRWGSPYAGYYYQHHEDSGYTPSLYANNYDPSAYGQSRGGRRGSPRVRRVQHVPILICPENRELSRFLAELQTREITPEDYVRLLELDELVKPKTLDVMHVDKLKTGRMYGKSKMLLDTPCSITGNSLVDVTEDVCVVCMDDLTEEEIVTVTPCVSSVTESVSSVTESVSSVTKSVSSVTPCVTTVTPSVVASLTSSITSLMSSITSFTSSVTAVTLPVVADEKEEVDVDVAAARLATADAHESTFVTRLPCGHVFHSSCIRTWLTTHSNKCPLDNLPVEIEGL